MKASFIDSFSRKVIVEPIDKQTKEQLIAKVEQIMRKRNITSEITIED